MLTVSGAWSEPETEAFLADATVPLRLACRTPAGGLWMLSLWYQYRDDRFELATSAESDVVAYLEEHPGVAFEISTNEPPYYGVRGAGRARIEVDEDKRTLRSLLDRYLDGTDSPLAARLLDEDREERRILLEPSRLHSWDYRDRMSTEGSP